MSQLLELYFKFKHANEIDRENVINNLYTFVSKRETLSLNDIIMIIKLLCYKMVVNDKTATIAYKILCLLKHKDERLIISEDDKIIALTCTEIHKFVRTFIVPLHSATREQFKFLLAVENTCESLLPYFDYPQSKNPYFPLCIDYKGKPHLTLWPTFTSIFAFCTNDDLVHIPMKPKLVKSFTKESVAQLVIFEFAMKEYNNLVVILSLMNISFLDIFIDQNHSLRYFAPTYIVINFDKRPILPVIKGNKVLHITANNALLKIENNELVNMIKIYNRVEHVTYSCLFEILDPFKAS